MVSMLPNIFLCLLGVLSFLYFFWVKLHDDYTSNSIFSAGFYILIASLVGAYLGFNIGVKLTANKIFLPQGVWFWGGFSGFLFGFLLAKWKFSLRFFESLEAAGMGMYVLLIILFLKLAYHDQSEALLGKSFVMFGILIVYFFLNARYKRFAWYKSGRVGLAGITAIGSYFVARCLIAVFFHSDMVSFVGPIESVISGVVAFVIFLMIYNLAMSKA